MKCLLLTLGLALACPVQDAHIPQTVEDLDIRKVWGGEDAAPSGHGGQQCAPPGHREWPPESSPPRAAPPRVYVEELKPTPEGDLEILLQKRWVSPHSTENHECVEKTLMAQKTEDPTVFTVDYHGERKISVLDTDYSSYMTFCKEGPTHTDEGSLMCQCLETTPEVDDEAMEKFARALASLSEDVQMVLDLRRGAVPS
ncbi:hypothetical protein AB1E18_009180 [Capra hircus]